MKRVFAIVLAALMLMTVFAGCDSKKEDELVMATNAAFPPYEYVENGEYVGFDLDLAQEVCERNGWELIKTPIDWDAKDMELNSGAIDCIWNGFTINGREDDYTWSEPYVNNTQVFAVKKGGDIASAADLAGFG